MQSAVTADTIATDRVLWLMDEIVTVTRRSDGGKTNSAGPPVQVLL